MTLPLRTNRSNRRPAPARAPFESEDSEYDPFPHEVTVARRRVLRAAMRDLLVRGGAVSGVVVGFLWALQRPDPAPPAACKATGSDAIGQCFGDGLVATLMPYILAMGAGAIAGAMIGMLLSTLLVGRKRSEKAAMRTATATSAPVGRHGRWITARYDGECRGCGSSISTGDRIFHRPGHTLCAACH